MFSWCSVRPWSQNKDGRGLYKAHTIFPIPPRGGFLFWEVSYFLLLQFSFPGPLGGCLFWEG